jgi:hypothetical protein
MDHLEVDVDTEVLDKAPDGWAVLDGALTAPRGYVFVCNRKSRWSGEYRHALAPEKVIAEWRNNHEIKTEEAEETGEGDEDNDEFRNAENGDT